MCGVCGSPRSPLVGHVVYCSSLRTCIRWTLLVTGLLLMAAAVAASFALLSGAIRSRRPQSGLVTATPPPTPRRRPLVHSVPSVMMELFHRGPHDQLQAEIVRSLTPRTVDRVSQRLPKDRVWEHLHLLIFDLPGVVSGETLHSAQLRLSLAFLDTLLRPVRGIESSVRVYWGSLGAEGEVLRQQVHDERVTFNCTQLILRCVTNQMHQGGELRLVVGVSLAAGVRVFTSLAGDGDQQPLLLLLYSSTDRHPRHLNGSVPGGRERRDTQADTEDYEEETNRLWGGAPRPTTRRPRHLCRRRPLYVDFAEINYDTWIVAPHGYQAYQCVGKCVYPLSDHLTPTKHAIVQTLVHGAQPAKTSRACCVPTRLDSISVLYLDAQGVLTYRLSYKDMVAAECGCR